ncbi:hypothetical protein Vafri_11774 [Volvox africanus]|uniref:FANCL UBC-like domain-containing protein n=1 Tax=Volvox africanus TaxID=51714 RepID=A0A8J4B8M2_9CHLO|nr:hypothetical protein Vafri_11774 [Volvox africanus]
MQLLLRDLDELGWGCLEEFDQDTARMTLILMDGHGREHRLRLNLPYDYPASPPVAATDLPTPFIFTWHPPPLPPFPDGGRCVSGNGAEGSGMAPGGRHWDRSGLMNCSMNAGDYLHQPTHQHQQQRDPRRQQHHHHHHHHQHLQGQDDGHVSIAGGGRGGGPGGGGSGASAGSACSSIADVFKVFQTVCSMLQSVPAPALAYC